jgi:membrane fusion protein (multidrug efflux system)
LAQARLDQTVIKTSFGEEVGLRGISVSDYIQSGQGLVALADVDPIKGDFRVPEVYLFSLEEGQDIAVTVDAFPGEVFRGEVYAIDPLIDVNGRAIRLRARIPNAQGRLRPGLFARVKVTVDARQNAVLVDEAALIRRHGGKFVYRIEDGQAILTKVEVGARQPGEVEILEGLGRDAVVVTAGHQRLSAAPW